MTEPTEAEILRRRAELGAVEAVRKHARSDLELECPPTGLPLGEGLRRIRRRNVLIDWLVTVLIIAMPLALAALGFLTLRVNARADKAAERADVAAVNGAAARDAAADAKAALVELQRTNDRLNAIVDAFALLATATTPEERAIAREAIAGASSSLPATPTREPNPPPTASGAPAPTPPTTPPRGESGSVPTASTTTTTTTTSSTSTTTTPPLVPAPCSIVPLPTCSARSTP